MGYSTEFTGDLKFANPPSVDQLAALNAMFGEDCREHPEWGESNLGYVDLELNDDFSGVRHDGAEKTYDLEKIVNVVTAQMRTKWPEFALTGQLLAQGEDAGDRWVLAIGPDGLASRQPVALSGAVVTCPHCQEQFALETAKA